MKYPLFLANCDCCELRKDAFQVVEQQRIYENYKLFILGESPGDREDLTGEPFSGPAGLYFKSLLQEVGIPSNECYFTYLTKCYAKSCKINKSELDTCKYWTAQQFCSTSPKVVLTLGAESFRMITGLPKSYFKENLSNFISSDVFFQYTMILPWYSEGYVFQRGKKVKKETIECLSKLKYLVGG